jgi:hypothetical protein
MSPPLAKGTLLCPSCQRAAAAIVDLTPKSAPSSRPSRPHKRGVSRSSRTLGAGCNGRGQRRKTSGAGADGKSRVVLTPRRWCQVCAEAIRAGDGGKKARSPGRARRKTLKPLRRECRLMRCTCGDYARVLFHFAREAAGASCAPGIPCALLFSRVAATTRTLAAPRECGGVAAVLSAIPGCCAAHRTCGAGCC